MFPLSFEKSPSAGDAIHHSGYNLKDVWVRRVLPTCVACAFFASLAAAQDTVSPNNPQVLAVFDGQAIGESQLPASEQAELQRMMVQVYGVRLRALHEVLDSKLVAAEAKKKGVSVDDLFKFEVLSKVSDPTDAEVSAYYEAHPRMAKQPLDAVKDNIRQEIKSLEIEKARTTYIQSLWEHALSDGDLALVMPPPVIRLPVDKARLRGDPKAPVTIVEFSDFGCPYCRAVEPELKELLAKYQGKIRLSYRDFPLVELHPQAYLAAEASRCAGEQGKFWEYHDLLFANPEKQTREGLIADALTVKMDETQFDSCLSSERYKPEIDQDIQLGSHIGVVSTPGFFINGNFIGGAQPLAVFEKAIDEALSASAPGNSGN